MLKFGGGVFTPLRGRVRPHQGYKVSYVLVVVDDVVVDDVVVVVVVCLFVCLLVGWFVGSLVRWFVGSLVRWFVTCPFAPTVRADLFFGCCVFFWLEKWPEDGFFRQHGAPRKSVWQVCDTTSKGGFAMGFSHHYRIILSIVIFCHHLFQDLLFPPFFIIFSPFSMDFLIICLQCHVSPGNKALWENDG